MNICIPVEENKGLESPVCAHFGSAPLYVIVNTETGEVKAIQNKNQHHPRGGCKPLASLVGHAVDIVVVSGIGMGALMALQSGGIEVYSSDFDTVAQTVEACKTGNLRLVTPDAACGHHGHGPHGQGPDGMHNRSFAARYRPGGCGSDGPGCGHDE